MLWQMAVPILQTLVALILVLLGVDTANIPPTTNKARLIYRAIFIFLGVLILTLSWIQYRNDQKKEAAFRAKIQATATNQIIVQPPPEKAVGIIDSNQLELQQKYLALLREVTTNVLVAPELREHLVLAMAKLAREAEGLKQVPGEEALSAAQSAREKILPFFDDAIRSLGAMSEKEAVLKGDKSVMNYLGLPDDLSLDARAGRRFRKNAAEIKFQKNADWDFQINFTEVVVPQYEASLSVTCKGGLLVLKNSGDAVETRVEVVSGKSSGHGPAQGDDAKKNIADALDKLVASELDAAEVNK
jgi:hypothetical protein